MLPVDACYSLAGSAGKQWRIHRRVLPPSVKDALASLLLELRLVLLPVLDLDCQSQIGRARCDIRGVAELLRHLAQPYSNVVAPTFNIDATVFVPTSLSREVGGIEFDVVYSEGLSIPDGHGGLVKLIAGPTYDTCVPAVPVPDFKVCTHISSACPSSAPSSGTILGGDSTAGNVDILTETREAPSTSCEKDGRIFF